MLTRKRQCCYDRWNLVSSPRGPSPQGPRCRIYAILRLRRRCPLQPDDGVLRFISAKRTPGPQALSHSRRTVPCHVRLHRSLLQPTPLALKARLHFTHGLRPRARPKNDLIQQIRWGGNVQGPTSNSITRYQQAEQFRLVLANNDPEAKNGRNFPVFAGTPAPRNRNLQLHSPAFHSQGFPPRQSVST